MPSSLVPGAVALWWMRSRCGGGGHSSSSTTVANRSLMSQLMQARAAYLDQEYLNSTPLRREPYDAYNYPDHTPAQSANNTNSHSPGRGAVPLPTHPDDSSHSTWETASSVGPQSSVSHLSRLDNIPSDGSHVSSLDSRAGDQDTDMSIQSKFSR